MCGDVPWLRRSIAYTGEAKREDMALPIDRQFCLDPLAKRSAKKKELASQDRGRDWIAHKRPWQTTIGLFVAPPSLGVNDS